jgi:hypothetical protein
VPEDKYSNIKFFTGTDITRIRLTCTGVVRQNDITPLKVPAGRQALGVAIGVFDLMSTARELSSASTRTSPTAITPYVRELALLSSPRRRYTALDATPSMMACFALSEF